MDLKEYLSELEHLVNMNVNSVMPYYNLSKLLIEDLVEYKKERRNK